jgi:uncharacterized membrane protein
MEGLFAILFTWLSPFIGRFHPLLVHLPIGFLMIAYIMEIMGRTGKSRDHLKKAVPLVLGIGAISALFAAGTGYLLSQSGEYSADSVYWHQWTGIGTAVLATTTYLLRRGKYYIIVFTLTQVAVIIAGHLGGQLTHGSDYLTENLPAFLKNEATQVMVSMNEAEIFPHVILPIFEKNCSSCHNESKMKGELVLTSYAELLKGGENGDITLENNAEGSDMIKRVHLPKDHDDAMPPEGKKRLTTEEIELLEFWIDTGLDNETKVTEIAMDERMLGIIEDRLNIGSAPRNAVYDKRIKAASEGDIEALTAIGFTITPIAKDSPLLQVAYFNRLDTLTKTETDELRKITKQAIWLDVSGANVQDWSFLKDLNNLIRLHVKNTSISDTDFSLIKGQNLEHLNLFGTGITTASMEKIKTLKKLKTLYVGKTSITKADLSGVNASNPELTIDVGGRETMLMSATQLAPPTHDLNNPFIDKPTAITIKSIIDDVQFYYTTDGTDPDQNSLKLVNGKLSIDRSTEIKVVAFKEGWIASEITSIPIFYKSRQIESLSLLTPPSEKYPARGTASLLDRNLGSIGFDDGSWLGFEENGTTMTMDLGKPIPLQKVSIYALEAIDQWIFLPKKLEVFVSDDGQNFRSLKTKILPEPKVASATKPNVLTVGFDVQKARYVRIKIDNIGKCPTWHPGSGKKAWMFLNEVIIE